MFDYPVNNLSASWDIYGNRSCAKFSVHVEEYANANKRVKENYQAPQSAIQPIVSYLVFTVTRLHTSCFSSSPGMNGQVKLWLILYATTSMTWVLFPQLFLLVMLVIVCLKAICRHAVIFVTKYMLYAWFAFAESRTVVPVALTYGVIKRRGKQIWVSSVRHFSLGASGRRTIRR